MRSQTASALYELMKITQSYIQQLYSTNQTKISYHGFYALAFHQAEKQKNKNDYHLQAYTAKT